MADQQKPVEVPETTPAVTEPVAETKPAEATEATPAPAATEEAKTEETPAAATTEAAAVETPAAEEAAAATEETKKEEVVPVEEGTLEHKGLNFPKNFIYSKQFFWFGSDALESKILSQYRRNEKSAEVGQHNSAWASETGKGLLFFGDKAAPAGVINLADASEPATDGPAKFHFTAKGHKYAFKAANTADRDNWVSQLKLKIAEAKELSTTVPEAETYKATRESFKPAPLKKKEDEVKAEAPVAAEAKEETPAAEAATAEETPAPAVEGEAAATEAAAETTEEPAKEAPKEKEEPKRRSASRKRTSIFGSLLGKKSPEPSKVEEPKAEESKDKPAETEQPAAEVEQPATETPVAAAEATTEAPKTEEAEAAPAATEAAAEPKAKEPVKPTVSKRNSLFGNLLGKKKVQPEEAVAAKEEPAPTSDSAPVIPPVEATTPLAVETTSPATVPVETKDVTPATNGETKKEVKSEKRKSSMPFAFGKKSPVASDEEGDKPEKTSAFSKLRATIKGRGKSPAAEKREEAKPEAVQEGSEDKPAEEKAAEDKPAEASTSAETPATTEAKPEEENKPEAAAPAPAPAVTAAA